MGPKGGGGGCSRDPVGVRTWHSRGKACGDGCAGGSTSWAFPVSLQLCPPPTGLCASWLLGDHPSASGSLAVLSFLGIYHSPSRVRSWFAVFLPLDPPERGNPWSFPKHATLFPVPCLPHGCLPPHCTCALLSAPHCTLCTVVCPPLYPGHCCLPPSALRAVLSAPTAPHCTPGPPFHGLVLLVAGRGCACGALTAWGAGTQRTRYISCKCCSCQSVGAPECPEPGV